MLEPVDHATRLSRRIATRAARISVIGQGYVGLPVAVEFAEVGFPVTGLDTDLERVAALASGRSHVPDVPSAQVQALLRAGRYQATTGPAVLAESDAVLICVPTPLRKSKDPDITYVIAAVKEAAARFRPGQLIVLESTTYPGTTEELLLPLFQASGASIGEDLFLAFSPERIDPGNPTFKVKDIPKVVGGVTPTCSRLAAALYREIVPQVHEVSTPKVAELAKLYENVFRNVNIALANEFSIMCRVLGVAYKRGIGDTRESPAHEIVSALRRKGAQVSYADPHVPTFHVDGTELKAVEPTEEDLRAADCVLILADHPEFDYGAIARHSALIVDTRHSVPENKGRRGR